MKETVILVATYAEILGKAINVILLGLVMSGYIKGMVQVHEEYSNVQLGAQYASELHSLSFAIMLLT